MNLIVQRSAIAAQLAIEPLGADATPMTAAQCSTPWHPISIIFPCERDSSKFAKAINHKGATG